MEEVNRPQHSNGFLNDNDFQLKIKSYSKETDKELQEYSYE